MKRCLKIHGSFDVYFELFSFERGALSADLNLEKVMDRFDANDEEVVVNTEVFVNTWLFWCVFRTLFMCI